MRLRRTPSARNPVTAIPSKRTIGTMVLLGDLGSEMSIRLTKKNMIPNIIAVPNRSVNRESNRAGNRGKVKPVWARTTMIKVTRNPENRSW
jgi:hypothetical protein